MTFSKKRFGTTRKTLAVAFIILTVAFLTGGYWFYRMQSEALRESSYENIASIAKMKVGQILDWRKERFADAGRAINSLTIRRNILQMVDARITPDSRKELFSSMEAVQQEGDYANVFLAAPNGDVLVAITEENSGSFSQQTKQALANALSSPKPVLSDFFRDQSGHVYLDIVSAVKDDGGKPVALMVLRCNAEDYLYPLVQSWPTPSHTAETLLVERDQGDVVFLNDLRHRAKSALSLRQPLSNMELPAVQAVLGKEGMFEGRDYRNESVLAYLCAVTGTPWFMVAKVDRSEILAHVDELATVTGAIVMMSILVAALVLVVIYNRRQTELYRDLLESERKQYENEALYRTTLYSIGDGVITTDTQGCLREMNPVAERLTGWTEAEARGKPLDEIFVIINQESRAPVASPVVSVLRNGVIVGLANHTLLIARDGTERAIADSAAPIRNEDGRINGVVLVFSDVTEQYLMREALAHSETEYRMLFDGMVEGFAVHEILCDASGKPVDYRFLSVNPAFERFTGLRAAEVVGRTVREVLPDTEEIWIERYGQVALTGDPMDFEEYSATLGRHFKITAFRPQRNQFAVLFDDITERKNAEMRIARLGQLYSALSQCNQAIVHSADMGDLFPQVCRDIVQFGGMRMAWIGLVNEDETRVAVAASYGKGSEYLQELNFQLNPEGPFGKGPTALAIRENRAVWCQDFQNDILTEAWRDKPVYRDCAASASLPLCVRGKVIGSLTIYSTKVDAFDEEVRSLLEEMAGDINFAIESFAREAERKQAEDALRESEAKLNAALSSMTDAVLISDSSGFFIEFNDAFASFHRFKDKAECAQKFFEYPDIIEVFTSDGELAPVEMWAVPRALRGETMTNTEYTLRRKDTGETWVGSYSFSPIRDKEGAIVGSVVVGRDITERKQVEEALQQNRNMLSHILNSIPQAVFWKDRNSVYLGCNEVFAHASGLDSAKEIIGKNDFELPWATSGAKDFISDDQEVMGYNRPKRHIVELVQRADGNGIWVDTTKVPLIEQNGSVYGVLGVFDDITEHRETEARLKLQGAALEAAANAIVITDKNGAIQWVNNAFTTYTGYCLEEVLGKNPKVLKSGKHDAAYYEDLWKTVLSGEVWLGEMENRRKDGSLYTEAMTITPIKDGQGEVTHFIAVKQDITERKQIEENLLRTQRMESIGTLASGVAHDLNNILTPIILSTEMLRSVHGSGVREGLITSIEKCAQRGAEIVNQVLTFARGTKGERISLQVDRLVSDIERIMHETFPKNIAITNDVSSDLWVVQGDPTQLHQVILNLCINARDAMPNGGSLRIQGENKIVDETFAAKYPDAKAGEYVMLSVSDTGMGIPPKIIGKIFDPFFTTKEVGKGTGLGLSTVIGIIRSHGGFVTAESEENHGSDFKIFLPIKPGEAVKKKRSVSTNIPQGMGETILVVDDEVFILKVTSMTLQKNGYKVLPANNAKDAITHFKKNPDAIALVLTDIMMPEMDGVQLSRALKEIKPSVKIIATTGQPTEMHRTELRSLGVHTIIRKPYDGKKLLSTLHDAIQAKE